MVRLALTTTVLLAAASFLTLFVATMGRGDDTAHRGKSAKIGHRSPVDVALSADGAWLATANQTSDSVSLVRTSDGQVLDEQAVGARPGAIALIPPGNRLLVSCRDSGELMVLAVADGRLSVERTITIGDEPLGLAVTSDGRKAFVALSAADCVAEIDLASGEEAARIVVGRQPRYLAVSEAGDRLAVGVSGERGIAIVDLPSRKLVHVDRFVGLNIGHLAICPSDGKAYFPWMVYRRNPITAGNIRLGWVLASRLARISLEGGARREAISLDPPGRAVADPHGVAVSRDGAVAVVSSSGTHELLVYDNRQLPYKDRGSTDTIEPALLEDESRFGRMELGGRPMGLRMAADQSTVYVANYLRDSVQVVDVRQRTVLREWPLCEPVAPTLARRGEAIFFDARRSLDQWYSCHSCHYEGGGNAVAMDTNNDGSAFSYKTVLPLYHVDRTAPWTWHGWQTDLADAVSTSITSTMLGPSPTDEDVQAVVEYLKTLRPPPRQQTVANGEAVVRGEKLFRSQVAACSTCHSGPLFTDGQVHDVGLGGDGDRYQGFNTPSLIGVSRKLEWLHDGRAKSLDELLSGPHAPQAVAGERALNDNERADLVEYLKSL